VHTHMVERPVLLHEENDMLDIFQRTCRNSNRKEYRDREIRCPRHVQFTITFPEACPLTGVKAPLACPYNLSLLSKTW
jgi:hypothetical protein